MWSASFSVMWMDKIYCLCATCHICPRRTDPWMSSHEDNTWMHLENFPDSQGVLYHSQMGSASLGHRGACCQLSMSMWSSCMPFEALGDGGWASKWSQSLRDSGCGATCILKGTWAVGRETSFKSVLQGDDGWFMCWRTQVSFMNLFPQWGQKEVRWMRGRDFFDLGMRETIIWKVASVIQKTM